jgi:hypothetical protein
VYAFWKIVINISGFIMVCAASASGRLAASDIPHPERVSGRFWQRVADPNHPEAPPRLVLMHGANPLSQSEGRPRERVMCARAGEKILVHQIGAESASSSLAATVLGSGACGASVRARIGVTGAVTEVRVLEEGIGILDGKENKWR